MVDLIFALYGIILIIFVVEATGVLLISLVKKFFKKSDEIKKELKEVPTIE